MSKLADAIRRATRREARPIGFAATAAKANPSLLLIARGAPADAQELLTAGADAVLSSGNVTLNGGSGFWGSDAPIAGREAAKELVSAGAGFVVFDADTTSAAVLLEDQLGPVMRISLDAEDSFLRTVESMSLDALLAPELPGDTLTVRRTLDLRRLASFARKPLLVPAAAGIDATTLETLRDCGVVGVIAEGADAVKALRATIDALPPRKRPTDSRGPAVGLSTRAEMAAEQPEEGEEDDD